MSPYLDAGLGIPGKYFMENSNIRSVSSSSVAMPNRTLRKSEINHWTVCVQLNTLVFLYRTDGPLCRNCVRLIPVDFSVPS